MDHAAYIFVQIMLLALAAGVMYRAWGWIKDNRKSNHEQD
jgi:hypothetical protein